MLPSIERAPPVLAGAAWWRGDLDTVAAGIAWAAKGSARAKPAVAVPSARASGRWRAWGPACLTPSPKVPMMDLPEAVKAASGPSLASEKGSRPRTLPKTEVT